MLERDRNRGAEELNVDYMMGLWKSGRRTRERIKGRMDGGIGYRDECGGEMDRWTVEG